MLLCGYSFIKKREKFANFLLLGFARKIDRNTVHKIVCHPHTVVTSATLRAIMVYVRVPSGRTKIPKQIIRHLWIKRLQASVQRRYDAFFFPLVTVKRAIRGCGGFAGVIHKITPTNNIIFIGVTFHSNVLVEKIALWN